MTADWEHYLRQRQGRQAPELSLDEFRPGDTLVVQTRHTLYRLQCHAPDVVEVTANRPDRPTGRARIQGCCLGDSASIKPGHLFTGGSLELVFPERNLLHRTSAIRSLTLIHPEYGPAPGR